MNKITAVALLSLLGALFSSAAFAAEPAYCSYQEFMKKRIAYQKPGLLNHAVFRFAGVDIVGLAVGHSSTSAVVAMARDLSVSDQAQKYCTWYFNDGNSQAARTFNWFPVERPNSDIQGSVAHYRGILKGIFADNAINMVDCAAKYGYVGLGCDGMAHRGPTIFGMLLAFSGCSPANAANIVNTLWGLNTVPAASRLAVITDGYRMGQANPKDSLALRTLLEKR